MNPVQIKAGYRLMAIYGVLLVVGLLFLLSNGGSEHRTDTPPVQDLSHVSVDYHSTCIDCEGQP